jgi:hypothetical protein
MPLTDRFNRRRLLKLAASHLGFAAGGFAAGVYALPILVAPPAPSLAEVQAATAGLSFTGQFRRNLKDSDVLHWGEGTVTVGAKAVALQGRLAPGPDYKLYLSPTFVETEADFKRLKPSMVQVGDVKTFRNFVAPVPAGVDVSQFRAVIIWCERFSEFITAAAYR